MIYFEVKNVLFGIIGEKDDYIQLIYGSINRMIYHIIGQGEEEEDIKIKKFKKRVCPDDLEIKFDNLLTYKTYRKEQVEKQNVSKIINNNESSSSIIRNY